MKLTKYSILTLFILFSIAVNARSTIRPTGGKPAGMGNAFVSQYDVFSVYHNQAGLANIDRTSISFFYENQFLVPELSLRSGLITFPAASGAFAVQYHAFGPAQWSESNASVAYSRFLSKKLSAGLQLNYYGSRLPEIAKTISTVSFELGAIYQITDNTYLGAHIANPYSPPMKTMVYEESIPWRFSLGGHTNFTETFTLSYEVEAIKSYLPTLQIGAQWEAVPDFFIRAGYNAVPSQVHAGFGYSSRFFTIDTAFNYHQYLGVTPSVSLIFSFF